MSGRQLTSQTWWEAEPDLLEQELTAINSMFPSLEWVDDGPGHLIGPIPAWPFLREAPENLDTLLGSAPFEIRVQYSHAFPAAPPAVFPLAPKPPIQLRSFTNFHVLGDGSLCLLRDAAQWANSSLTSDLILKAAAWRLEYALLERGAIQAMTQNGIVVNGELDQLLVQGIQEMLVEG